MIRIEGLSKTYGSRTAIRDISFEVRQGEVLGFLGPNGAGKTTTMKIITSFMPPTSGSVEVMGYDTVRDSLHARRCIGYLPEHTPLYHDMRVEAFLRFAARAKGVRPGQVAQRVDEVSAECGLIDVRRNLIGTLSKGYRQRVGLAQALINDPPVLVLDEPSVGLDPRQIYEIRQLIKDLSGTRTIILSSHILPEVSQLCDRVAIINHGRIVAVDTPAALTATLQEHASIVLTVGQRQDEALELISAVDGVLSVSAVNARGIHVETTPDADLRPVLVRRLVERGIDLLEIRRREMSLEEVFMELVTEEVEVDA